MDLSIEAVMSIYWNYLFKVKVCKLAGGKNIHLSRVSSFWRLICNFDSIVSNESYAVFNFLFSSLR